MSPAACYSHERDNMTTFRDVLQMLDAPVTMAPSNDSGPWVVGAKYLIRTVTNYWVGELCSVYPMEIVLKNASWIADTGRYADCLQDGSLKEVEAVPHRRVIVGRGAIDDAADWRHPLPAEQK